jgi:protein-S-isoprenylcysteine O-methyltransferase Ste14
MSRGSGPRPVLDAETAAGVRRWLIKSAASLAAMAAVLFGSAGTFRWVGAWWYLALIAGNQALLLALLLPNRPDLLAERSEVRQGTKPWDPPLAASMAIVGPMAMALIAGLDVRHDWIGYVSPGLAQSGLLTAVVGSSITIWSMVANAYFSGIVRIQAERGHQVISSGPYRIVRHPGYLGAVLVTLGTPYLLGSRWAVFASWMIVGVIVLRTWLEDRTLSAELPGYREYAQRVRYRLLPWIW